MKKYKGERNIEQIWKNPMSLSLAVVLQASGDGGSRDSRGHTRERRWWFNVWRRRVVTKRKRRKRGKKKKSMRKMKVSDFFVLERKIKLKRWKGEGRLWSWMGVQAERYLCLQVCLARLCVALRELACLAQFQ